MEVEFENYCGLAGDLQELLIAKNEKGIQVETLISRTGWFRYYKMKRAKKKLLVELELITGKKHTEKH